MSYCYSIGTAFGEHPDKKGVRVYKRLDDRKWTCDHCGPKKAKRYPSVITQNRPMVIS
jgi:hypothetical protein